VRTNPRPPSLTCAHAAIAAAAEHLPRLQVVLTPHCDGATWIVDTTTDTVYLDGSGSADQAARSLLDALDTLCAHHGIPTPQDTPRHGLRLIHGQSQSTRTVSARNR